MYPLRTGTVALLSTVTLACTGLVNETFPMTEADRAPLLDPESAVTGLGIETSVDPTATEWSKLRNPAGEWRIQARYEHGDLLVQHIGRILPSDEEARTSHEAVRSTTEAATRALGWGLDEAPGLFSWGEAHTCWSLTDAGEPVGVLCTALKGNRSTLLMVSWPGLEVTEPGAIDGLLAEPLSALEAYEPSP